MPPPPRVLLSAFALLLASVLLLACGSDELMEGPDSERPTRRPTSEAAPEPTTRALSGRATAQNGQPTAITEPTPEGPPCNRREPGAAAVLSPAQTSPETDREALIALFNATDGESWDRSNTWLGRGDIGGWQGVTTDDNGRVIRLVIGDMLRGELPPELGNLTSLQVLDFIGNRLSGEILPELANLADLPSLGVLDLSNNQLSGETPPEFERWWPGSLILDGNNFIGCVSDFYRDYHGDDGLEICEAPDHAGDTEALIALYEAWSIQSERYWRNWLGRVSIADWEGLSVDSDGRVVALRRVQAQMVGEIPPELGNLTSLEMLDLSFNGLSGEIPPELGNLASLRVLNFERNEYDTGTKLSGEIPPGLGNLSSLQTLDLYGNDLSGEIPPKLADLPSLTGLNLSDNQLSGEIPPELGNLPSPSLRELRLNDNQLSGCVPAALNRNDLGVINTHQGFLQLEFCP